MLFGAPRRREVSQNKEKYENVAVITVSAFQGKGTARMIGLNPKAIEALELDLEKDAQVSFSFDKLQDLVVIANTTGLTNVSEVRVAKTSKSLSDKKYFEAIKKNFEVEMTDELELKLVDNNQDFNGFKTFRLEKMSATNALESVVDDAVSETEVVSENVSESPDPVVYEPTMTDEAPLEYIKEQAEERDVFAEVAESTESDNPFAAQESKEEVLDDNPFLELGE